LWKCLGVKKSALYLLYTAESLITVMIGIFSSLFAAGVVSYGICTFLLDIPLEFPAADHVLLLVLILPLVFILGTLLFIRSAIRVPAASLLRSAEEF
jgi:ABC-type antimicrobial peptide transport system permease subunit